MGLIRSLIRAIVDHAAGEDKGSPPPPPNTKQQQPGVTTPGQQATPAAGYGDYEANIPPPPQNSGYTNDPRKKDKGPNRFLLGYKMLADEQWRWRYSLRSTVRWAITMVIVGIIFVCLTATGTYPTSVANQKYLNVFAEGLTKYSLYIFAGLIAIVGVGYSRRLLAKNVGTVIPQAILLLAALIAVATIGMSIQILVDVNNAESVAWWEWLILVLIILQRILFTVATSCAIWTLRVAEKNPECHALVV